MTMIRMSITWAATGFAALLAAGLVAAGVTLADSGTAGGATYTTATATIDAGVWRVTVGQLRGGNSSVTTAFNAASRASGQTMTDMLDADHMDPTGSTFESRPTVIFRPTTVEQVLVGTYYWRLAAHPVNYITTIVIDTRTATPITLADLFTDSRAGLNRLSEQTKRIFPTVYGNGTPMGDEPGNAPTDENFHNWIATGAGLEIHVVDGQFGHGLPVITVPWSQLSDLLAPAMRILAQ
nr:hypothetical protein ICEMyc226_00157 [Mycolicibacterium sp.]